jgi:transcriptional regulator with GAF, ATPase, and Fis domain
MWQSRSSEERIQPTIGNDEVAKLYDGQAGDNMHLGVLRELVISLLNQLNLLHGAEQPEAVTAPANFYDEVRRFEIELINHALCRTHGHQQKAARLLGVKPTTLNSKIKRYNIMFPYFSKVSGL